MTTITVTSLADSGAGSLRAALATNANQGGDATITFDLSLAGGTIALLSTLTIAGTVTIDGSAGAGLDITLDAGGQGTVIKMPSGTVTLRDLVVTGGHAAGADQTILNGNDIPALPAAGGIWMVDGTLTLDQVQVVGNDATGGNGSTFSLEYNNDFNGQGEAAAGGVLVQSGTLLVRDSVFVGNSGTGGNSQAGQLNVRAGIINTNLGQPGGNAAGAIYCTAYGIVDILNTGFISNSGTGGIGGSSLQLQNDGGYGGFGGAPGGTGAGAVLAQRGVNGPIPVTGSGLTFGGNSGLGGYGGSGAQGPSFGPTPGGLGGGGGAPGQPGLPGGAAAGVYGGAGAPSGAPGQFGPDGGPAIRDPFTFDPLGAGGGGGGGGGGLGYADSNVTIACFAAGTRIATPTGEQAVETLRPGDLARSAFGGTAPVHWVGSRTIPAPAPPATWPIRILAGAFGDKLPARDLLLSPDHAVLVDDVLIPIRTLQNGTTIRPLPVHTVTYHHIELPVHDAVLAEGLPAETYLDTGNRTALTGPQSIRAGTPQEIWNSEACAPQITHGPIHAAVRARLDARARGPARSRAA